MLKIIKLGIIYYCFIQFIISCSPIDKLITERELEINNYMMDSIFIDPISYYNKSIYVNVRNNTGYKSFSGIDKEIKNILIKEGYNITDNSDEARYVLQANLIFAGEIKADDPFLLTTIERNIYDQDYGVKSNGYFLGNESEIKSVNNNIDKTTIFIQNLIKQLTLSEMRHSLIKKREYLVITDIEIAKRTDNNITTNESRSFSAGIGGKSESNFSTNSNWQKYRTKLLTTAGRVNLKMAKVEDELSDHISYAIAEIF